MLTESQHVDTAVCSLQSNRFMIVRFAFFMKHRRYGVGWSWLSATYSVIAFEGYTLFFFFFSACSKGAFHSRLGSPWSIYSWIDSKLCKIAAICLQLRNILMKCFTSICRFFFFFPHCETNLSTDVALNREGSCQFGIPPVSIPLNSAIYGSTQASTLSLT